MNLENSLYKVTPSPFDKKILLPTSKSHSNRALILGAIKGNGFRISNLSQSTDVLSLLACLRKIGLDIIESNNEFFFKNSFPACESTSGNSDVVDLKTGDGGTTNRFLMALLSLGKKKYRLFPSEKMSERPIEDLLIPLKQLNVSIESFVEGAWISLQGPAQILNLTKLEIDCKLSTQFASAMLLSFSGKNISFEFKNILASEAYIKMTQVILDKTQNNDSYIIPVDFSSLSYPIAGALINGKVVIENCFEIDSTQADSRFIEIMKNSGGDIEWTKEGLIATSKKQLSSFDVDGSEFPDLIPTLIFIASHIKGISKIRNLEVLRHKESDRLAEIIKLLNIFSIHFQFDEIRDEIIITGKEFVIPELKIQTARDHRMVMMAYLFLRANAGGFLAESDCVEKSFPHFFDIV